MNKLMLNIIIIFLIVFYYSCLSARTLEVSKSGSVFSKINDALSRAASGDIIIVGPGVYYENIYLKNMGNIKISGSGPNNTKIQSEDSEKAIFLYECTNIYIKGFSIISGGESIYIYKSSGVVQNCYITSSGHGIYVNTSITTVATIKNCIINSCRQNGIHTNSIATTILNNTIVANNGFGIVGDCTIRSNIIAYNGNQGISSVKKSYISHNNYFKNNQSNLPDFYELSLGDISEDPLFIDYDSGNFALQSISPCVNTGIVGSQYLDPDGTRNDMGAYGGPAAAFFWPYISGGPIVTEIEITPSSVPKGSKIQLKAIGVVQ